MSLFFHVLFTRLDSQLEQHRPYSSLLQTVMVLKFLDWDSSSDFLLYTFQVSRGRTMIYSNLHTCFLLQLTFVCVRNSQHGRVMHLNFNMHHASCNFNIHVCFLAILLKCRFEYSSSLVEPRVLIP
jgi:hypothetical protein